MEKQRYISHTHVPDKVYAYSLQVRHLLYELISCQDNDVVSIEVFDDVAIEKKDGTVDAIQVKSVLSKNNPISNRAVDFWKTLYNWLVSLQCGELKLEQAKFRLFIAAPRKGNIANLYSDANSTKDAEDAWRKSRKEFYDENGQEKEFGKSYGKYVREFFSNENKHLACGIIKNFTLQTSMVEGHTLELYQNFCRKTLIPDDLVELAFDAILGWIDKKTAEQIENYKAMAISYEEFRAQLIAITRDLNQKLSLYELAPRPTDEDIRKEYSQSKRYLEQLQIIDCDYSEKLEAINDYLRASSNRTIWAVKGYLSDNSLSTYEEELIKKWTNERKIISLTERDISAEEQGQLLYYKCRNNSISNAQFHAPSFFISGCYHALSNASTIGWHPNYEKIIKGCEEHGGA